MSKEEIKFRSAYSGQVKKHCPSGTEYKDEYGYEINSKGQKELVKTGKKNLYEEIQAELEETKIENVLRRVAAGDMSDFRPTGIYQDITEIPNNLIEAKKEMQKVENLWNKLDTETKAKYGWSLENYMAEAGKESWLIDSGFINKEADEPVVEQGAQTTIEKEVTE